MYKGGPDPYLNMSGLCICPICLMVNPLSSGIRLFLILFLVSTLFRNKLATTPFEYTLVIGYLVLSLVGLMIILLEGDCAYLLFITTLILLLDFDVSF